MSFFENSPEMNGPTCHNPTITCNPKATTWCTLTSVKFLRTGIDILDSKEVIFINVPQTFTDGVLKERGTAGQDWLEALPAMVDKYCRLWHLQIDGAAMHGYVALVVPVLQDSRTCVLKISFVDDETKHESDALTAWKGEGAVLVLEADNDFGVLLLERLDSRNSLASIEIGEATTIAATLLKRLAIQAPSQLSHTGDYANRQAGNLFARWNDAGRPFSETFLEETILIAQQARFRERHHLVNQDLHFKNVLRNSREEWLVIDPKPVAGDIEFGAAPLLWNRTKEGSILERLEIIMTSADLDKTRLKAWTQLRVVDYWLWAIEKGFTENPGICKFLVNEIKNF